MQTYAEVERIAVSVACTHPSVSMVIKICSISNTQSVFSVIVDLSEWGSRQGLHMAFSCSVFCTCPGLLHFGQYQFRDWNDISFSPDPVTIYDLQGLLCSCFKAKSFVLINIISWNNHWVIFKFRLLQALSSPQFLWIQKNFQVLYLEVLKDLFLVTQSMQKFGIPHSIINTEAGV